ncbi:MAG TPA: aldo/keto reductase [Caldilineae bacterium]|nr:aldo/keto reductase [Caldilineae bacterium]
MRYRVLGKTGLEVSELSMGGLFIASFATARKEACRAVRRALELGINYFDTAPSYHDSEQVLGYALDGVAQPHIVSTKLGGRPQPFNPQDKDALRRSVEESLRLLKRDCIDILFIHEPDRPGQYDWFTDRSRFHGPVCELLEELKSEGIIRFTGLGGTTAYELARIIEVGDYDVVLTAFNYSLLWQEALIEVIPAARKRGMGIIIGSPLQQGALARRYDAEVLHGARWLSKPRREQFKRLYALLDEIEMSLPELALRFVISNPDISTVLMGARSVAEVEANVRAVEKGPLPADILARIQEIAAMVPFRPFEEPFVLPFGREDREGPGPAR